MDKRREEVGRAANAARILNDPMFAEAFGALMDRAERALMDWPYEEPADLVRARKERDWLKELKAALETHITTGKMAERQLQHGR